MENCINLFGTEVDFSAIATDNVPEVDISDDILEEKLSFLMLWKNPSGLTFYENRPKCNPCRDCEINYMNNPKCFVPECRNGHSFVEYVEPCERKKQFDCDYEDYSFLTYAKGKNRNYVAYFCEDENIPFKERCAYGRLPHYDRTLRDYFKESGIYSPVKIDDAIVSHLSILGKLSDHFYPKQTNWRPPQQTSYNKKENYHLPLSFRFNRESGVGDSLVLKAYSICDNQFLKAYYPVSLVHFSGAKPKDLQYSMPDQVWAKIPREDRQILFNLDKINTAKTVVICAALEDAWILQNKNETNDVVFTAFKCDPWQYDQVDFSVLKEKEVVILISNYNGSSLAEEFCDTEKLVSYLENIKISNISFVQREIVYPSIEDVWSYQELIDVYKKQPPTIKEKSLIFFTREQFDEYLKLAKEEIERKETESADKPFYLPQAKIETGDSMDETDEGIRCKNMLIRPILSKGDITLVYGPSKSGKSIFTMMLCGLYASSGSHKSIIDGMAFKRCLREKDDKSYVVYVAFDNNIVQDFKGYRNRFVDCNFKETDRFKFLNMVTKASECFKDHNVLVEKINETVGNKQVGVIVIDSLYALAGNYYMSAVNDYSVKLFESFPNAAVLWIHHSNDDGTPAGGERIKSAVSIWIDFSADPEDEDNRIIKLGGNPVFLKEEKDFKVKITNHGFELLDPQRTEDEMCITVYKQYCDSKGAYALQATEAARLLSYSSISAISHKK